MKTAPLNVVADDEARTLTVTLANPCAYFLDLCGFTTYYPVKVDLADSEGAWAVNPETYIGTGPFRMTNFAVDDVAAFEKNPTTGTRKTCPWAASMPTWRKTALRSWQPMNPARPISLRAWDPAEFERLNATYPGELVMGEQLGTYYILFNVHKDLSPEGKTLTIQEQSRVRYALGLMINRQDEVDYVHHGRRSAGHRLLPERAV